MHTDTFIFIRIKNVSPRTHTRVSTHRTEYRRGAVPGGWKVSCRFSSTWLHVNVWPGICNGELKVKTHFNPAGKKNKSQPGPRFLNPDPNLARDFSNQVQPGPRFLNPVSEEWGGGRGEGEGRKGRTRVFNAMAMASSFFHLSCAFHVRRSFVWDLRDVASFFLHLSVFTDRFLV